MGEAKRKKLAEFGPAGADVEGAMRIVRLRDRRDGTHRVEFFMDNMAALEAYRAICHIKQAFERKAGFSEEKDGGLPPRPITRPPDLFFAIDDPERVYPDIETLAAFDGPGFGEVAKIGQGVALPPGWLSRSTASAVILHATEEEARRAASAEEEAGGEAPP